MANDNDGALLGVGLIGVLVVGGLAWMVSRGASAASSAGSAARDVVESGGGSNIPIDSTSDIAGTIDVDVGSGEFGTGGIAAPSEFEDAGYSGDLAYEYELRDDDGGTYYD